MIINGEFINYRIYEGAKIVTLVTCDDINNKIRYIVKAREIK